MRFDDNRPATRQWIKNLLKRIFAFRTFQINVFHIFHPQIRILVRHGKKRARTNVISLFLHFFLFFPIHKSKFRRILEKNGIGLPLTLFVYIFSYLLIQISKRFGKRWSWTPNEPALYPFVTACVFGHSIRQ